MLVKNFPRQTLHLEGSEHFLMLGYKYLKNFSEHVKQRKRNFLAMHYTVSNIILTQNYNDTIRKRSTAQPVMALVRRKRSGRTGPPLKKSQKVAPTKQNIALFFLSRTMTVTPCLQLNFRKKVGIRYETKIKIWVLIKSDDFFLEITLFWDEKNLAH